MVEPVSLPPPLCGRIRVLRQIIFVTFRNQKICQSRPIYAAIAQVYRGEKAGGTWTFLSSSLFLSLHNHFYVTFMCVQMRATLWMPSRKDSSKLNAIIVRFERLSHFAPLYDGRLFMPPSECGSSEQLQILLPSDVVGRHVVQTS